MVELSIEEKQQIGNNLAKHLPALRKCMGFSQEEFGARIGLSRRRVSLIENLDFEMTWSQLTSMCLIFNMNVASKSYCLEHNLFPCRMMQFLQGKSEEMRPELFIAVSPSMIDEFLKVSEFSSLKD